MPGGFRLLQTRSLLGRFRRIGLQQRIMVYVTLCVLAMTAIYGLIAHQAVQQSTDLVYRERLLVARTIAHALDERWVRLGPGARDGASVWLASSFDPDVGNYIIEVFDTSGAVVARQPAGRSTVSKAHLDLIAPFWQAHEPGWGVHTLQVNGQTTGHVVAFAPLDHVGWGVIVEQPLDAAFSLPRAMQTQFLLYALLALVGGVVLAWFTTRRVVRPIKALINASQAIAQGDLDRTLDVSGEGEVGSLARSFDEMRVALKQSHEEVAHWNRELERRVEVRTRELAALVASSHALTSTLDLDALFDILMREVRAVLPSADGSALFLYEPETHLLSVRSSHGFADNECRQLHFGIGEGISGKLFESQAPMLLRSNREVLAQQADFSPPNRQHFEHASRGRTVQSVLGVPLVAKGARLGALTLYSFVSEAAFTEGDVAILQALADQAASAIENARLYAVRTQLLEKVIEAQEEERKRIARDLHDEFAQTLTALTINLQTTLQGLPPELGVLRQQLVETHDLTAQTLKETSQLILELRPTVLDDLGLVSAIRWYARSRLESSGVQVSVGAAGLKRRLPTGVETALFRIVQEAVSNIAKHARAQHVSVHLASDEGHIRVEVQDDGSGFDAGDAFAQHDGIRGLGLLGMRERASLLGGTLDVHSEVGHGTCMRVEVPWTDGERT